VNVHKEVIEALEAEAHDGELASPVLVLALEQREVSGVQARQPLHGLRQRIARRGRLRRLERPAGAPGTVGTITVPLGKRDFSSQQVGTILYEWQWDGNQVATAAGLLGIVAMGKWMSKMNFFQEAMQEAIP
jgi:hypothetical protein